jgi:hypothetical protein
MIFDSRNRSNRILQFELKIYTCGWLFVIEIQELHQDGEYVWLIGRYANLTRLNASRRLATREARDLDYV